MKLSIEQAENLLRKKMRTNQIIFTVAIFLAMGVFLYSRESMFLFMSLYFIILGALNLPAINKCKSDINDYKNNELKELTGKVLDLFPQKENDKENKLWYIFIQADEDSGEYVEFSLPQKLEENISINKIITIKYTKSTQLPVEITLKI